ncbi:MAG: radical SAM protein [bacterium]|nr:radical SAM protein [bacterium]
MKKKIEYADERPISFLDILAANSKGPERFYWARLAYQLTIIVTQACNMHCTYCYDKSRVDRELERHELSAEEIVSIIRDARSFGVRQIKLTGGEVLLKRGIDQILKACEGAALYLCTNGCFLDSHIAFLKELSFARLHIHTSIDGLASHQKYAKDGITADELLAVMRRAKKAMPEAHFSFNTVINVDNVQELEAMHLHLANDLADKWTISTPYVVSEVVRNNHPFPDFEETAIAVARLLQTHFRCGEPFHLSVGCLYKHEMFDTKTVPLKTPDDHPCLPNCNGARGIIIDSFGNILDCLLENVEERGTLKDFQTGKFVNLTKTIIGRPFYLMRIADVVQCAECRYVALCGGGCRYETKALFGTILNPDPIRCSYYPLMEKHILPVLSQERRRLVESRLNLSGSIPALRFRNVADILKTFLS